MPILAPELSPELLELLLVPLLAPPATAVEVVDDTITEDVSVVPPDVKTVTEVLLTIIDDTIVETGPDVTVAELNTPDELWPALVLAAVELCVGAADPEVRTELG